jgi:hypothetical protein
LITFDDVTDRTPVTVDDVDYLLIVAVNRPDRRELIIYCVDIGQVVGLSFMAQPDVYWVTLPLDDRVIYTGNDVAAAIRWLTLEDQI